MQTILHFVHTTSIINQIMFYKSNCAWLDVYFKTTWIYKYTRFVQTRIPVKDGPVSQDSRAACMFQTFFCFKLLLQIQLAFPFVIAVVAIVICSNLGSNDGPNSVAIVAQILTTICSHCVFVRDGRNL